LRKEFQQLELLNVITKLRYEGNLPENVTGETRSALIRSFQDWKGADWCPPGIHPAIRWSKASPIRLSEEKTSRWEVVRNKVNDREHKSVHARKAQSSYVPAKGTTTLSNTNDEPFSRRRGKTISNHIAAPAGMRWSADTLSCAYDSLLTIMHLLYTSHTPAWMESVNPLN
ncbi:uncharacterized protein STEHIDRAFT_43126, partial [Stereum hirsutum FP-91666 SS1]